jgi:hypothetical protein
MELFKKAHSSSNVGAIASHARAARAACLPVSGYPPLKLPHPVELFGSSFQLRISTALTFSPDTLARAVLDTSMDAAVRKGLPKWHLLLRELAYIIDRKHTPTKTTKAVLMRQLAPVLPEEALRRALSGQEVATAQASDWAQVLKGLEHRQEREERERRERGESPDGSDTGDGTLKALATCLAACDAHVLEHLWPLARQDKAAADLHLQSLFAEEHAAWRSLNPRLLIHVSLLVEVSLKALASLECRGPHPAAGPDPQTSCVDGLLSPGLRPIGQWLKEVCTASECKNLARLARRLEWRSKYHDRAISHDLLRTWSGSKKGVMPAAAMTPVLAAVRHKNWADTLPNRFYVARFFTFVCDLLRAATIGEPPDWAVVQEQVRSRYAQAYRLQVAHTPAQASAPV